MTGISRIGIITHRQVVIGSGVAGRHQMRGLVDDPALGVDVPKAAEIVPRARGNRTGCRAPLKFFAMAVGSMPPRR